MKVLLIVAGILLFSPLAHSQSIYEIKFITGVTQYRAALILYDNGTGKMRVRYYSQQEGATMVEEYVRLENTNYGYRLTGYNPVFPGTSRRYPGYVADNFYISQDEYGNLSLTNIDDRGVTAKSNIRIIRNTYEQNRFLSDFSWRFN